MDVGHHLGGNVDMVSATASPSSSKASLSWLSFVILLQLIAYWHAWQWYCVRVNNSMEESAGLFIVVTVLGAMMYLSFKANNGLRHFSLWPIVLLLVVYGITYPFVPPIVRSAIAITSMLLTIYLAAFGARPPIAFWGMALLTLPVVPTLQFYIGYPARVISAALTVPLLQLNGLSVVREGTYLRWQNELLQFDAPCSGVTMLWAGLFLTLLISFVHRFTLKQTLVALSVGGVLVLFGNVLRASSLFYLEVGLFSANEPWWHMGVGVITFLVTAYFIVITLNRFKLWCKHEIS